MARVSISAAVVAMVQASAPELQCPYGWDQVGGKNADIQGCGLEGCGKMFSVPNVQACSQKCEWSGLGCKAFSWAPVGGDHYHMDKQVCTIYGTDESNQVWGPNQILCKKAAAPLQCPKGWVEPAGLNDIQGCGIQACDSRYTVPSLEACSQKCDADGQCKSFTWAPVGGDQDHLGERVCTLYGLSTPNQAWGPKQIMCKKEIPEMECPDGFAQVGERNADIGGCGLESCDGRYNVPSLEACSRKCLWSYMGCKAFSWAPIGGDKNHPSEKVCTMYGHTSSDRVWGPNQILCKIALA